MTLSRRTFLKGGLIAGTMAAGASLAACAPSNSGQTEAITEESAENKTYEIAETIEADVVIVGSGMAGLAAAVQAGELGMNAIVLEKLAAPGGNTSVCSGIAAVGTPEAEAAGVEEDVDAICQYELETYNYEMDITYFKETMAASAENVEWLKSNGVYIGKKAHNFKGGHYTMHYYGGDTYENHTGKSYTDAMVASAEGYGVKIMTETPAVQLVQEESKVTGVIAERADGTYLQINAKGIVLAAGGWASSVEIMEQRGYPEGTYYNDAMPGHDGDGWRLALEAGAYDMSYASSYIDSPFLADFWEWPDVNDPMWTIMKKGGTPWVNKQGVRFCREDCAMSITGRGSNAILAQEACYTIFDQKHADAMGQDVVDRIFSFNDMNLKHKADTLEELAEQAGIDPAMVDEIARYNEMCKAGEDVEFGKDSSLLASIDTPPFYACKLATEILCSIGGVRVNHNMQAAGFDWKPIEGLYVIGVDSNPSYPGMYNYSVPGGSVSYCVHSGRVAIKHINGIME